MFPFTAVIFGGGVILLDYINKIAPYPLIGFVSHFTTECNWSALCTWSAIWGAIWSAILHMILFECTDKTICPFILHFNLAPRGRRRPRRPESLSPSFPSF